MLQMKLCGDPVLREICTPVEKIDDELLQTLDEMVQMIRDRNGKGLAAPQVGITQRFLVMISPLDDKIFKMINPVIVSRSEKMVVKKEGCLSVLDKDNVPFCADIARHDSITVEWTNENGEKKSAKMSGFKARIVQHETDHLDGILFIDHLPLAEREEIMRNVQKYNNDN